MPPPPTPDLSALASVDDFEPLARGLLAPEVYDYVAGGAANEVTVKENDRAWNRLCLGSRVLVDVSSPDPRVRLFGQDLPHPVLLAPTAYHGMIHEQGELETARGAAQCSAIFVSSCFSNFTIEEIAASSPATLWFQLYMQKDREFTRALIARSEAANCRALCLTVDQPARGYRDRDIRNRFALPAGLQRANLRGLTDTAHSSLLVKSGIFSAIHDPSFSWRDLDWLRSVTRVPLLLKGILTVEDAGRALDAGVDGLIVSNHGGRGVDTLPATASVLPAIADRLAGRLPLLADGGIRRGTDILKAVALGASAVLIGRPYLYALAYAGAAGVARSVQILVTELEMALALTGRPVLRDVDRSVISGRFEP